MIAYSVVTQYARTIVTSICSCVYFVLRDFERPVFFSCPFSGPPFSNHFVSTVSIVVGDRKRSRYSHLNIYVCIRRFCLFSRELLVRFVLSWCVENLLCNVFRKSKRAGVGARRTGLLFSKGCSNLRCMKSTLVGARHRHVPPAARQNKCSIWVTVAEISRMLH